MRHALAFVCGACLAVGSHAAPVTLAWDASPLWPPGTTVELQVGNTVVPGITASSHTLDVPYAPGDLLDVRARAVAPDDTTSEWATLRHRVPAQQQDLWATWEPSILPPAPPTLFKERVHEYRSTSSTNTLTVTFAQVDVGDLLLVMGQREAWTKLSTVVSPFGALARVVNLGMQTSTFGSAIYGIVAPSSGTNVPVTFSFSSSAPWGALVGVRYAGVRSSTPLATRCFPASCTGRAASSTQLAAATTLPAAPGTLVVVLGSGWDLEQSVTAAAGFTVRDGPSSTQFALDSLAGDARVFGTLPRADMYFGAMMAFPTN